MRPNLSLTFENKDGNLHKKKAGHIPNYSPLPNCMGEGGQVGHFRKNRQINSNIIRE